MSRRCLNCTVLYDTEHITGKYCSFNCYRVKENVTRLKPPLFKICEVCNKEYQLARRSAYKKQRFCDEVCRKIGKSLDHKDDIKQLDTIFASYLAGFIDGEGCFRIVFRKGTSIPKLTLLITNTDYKILCLIRERIGIGNICEKQRKSLKHKQAYTYQITSQNLGKLIEQLIPYLQTKKDQAELMLEVSRKLFNKEERIDSSWYIPLSEKLKELKKVDTSKEKYNASIL